MPTIYQHATRKTPHRTGHKPHRQPDRPQPEKSIALASWSVEALQTAVCRYLGKPEADQYIAELLRRDGIEMGGEA